MLPDAEMNRLRWRCTRRAMLEMDLLLGKFLDEKFPQLNEAQAAAFVALADLEDMELWPLISGYSACPDAVRSELVAMLRELRLGL